MKMCWNEHVSLNTFVFSMFVLLLVFYNDFYTPYKINPEKSLYFYFFVISFASMQLVEYFLWRNLNDKKKVQTISLLGQLLVLVQPIASLLMLKNDVLKWGMILLYSVPAFFMFMLSNKNYKTTVVNGHLKWNWMPTSDFMYLIWLFFLLFSFIVNGHFYMLFAAFVLFVITYWSNHSTGTAGSLWCWSINLFMIYFAIQLLVILPFQEHGVC